MTITRRHAADTVAATLAAETCCSPADLRRMGVHVTELVPDRSDSALRRRFPRREESLDYRFHGRRCNRVCYSEVDTVGKRPIPECLAG